MTKIACLFASTMALAALAACSGGGSGPTQPRATATPVQATPSPTPSPVPSPITVTDSGSTNTNAFVMTIDANDAISIVETNRATGGQTTRTGTATAASVSQLYEDVNANTPMSGLATTTACQKSASYGTTTTISYEGSTSQDISCPASTPTTTIYNDVRAVENQFGPYN